MNSTFDTLCDKIASNQRLSAAEGEFLFRPDVDLHALGQLANRQREAKNGNRAYYNINAHLNPTNVCVYRCPLCAFSCGAGDAKAYVLGDEAILARGQEAVEAGATELHIVGGVHPEKPFAWYVGILRQLHVAYPSLHLKAWTAVEIDSFARQTGRSHQAILETLQEAGLGSLPGGGAEIFHPEVRRQIAPAKADADTWLAVHRTAHRLGLRTNATMLYGHVESPAHRVDHLLRLRQLQDETGGFQAFIPLAFHADGTPLADRPGFGTAGQASSGTRLPPSSLESLRVLAISRLLLDNFDHIKAYWISLGVGTAQVALAYGADDLDGTVRHEQIHHDAGATSPEVLTVAQLTALIREAGREPVERDTLYRPVERPE